MKLFIFLVLIFCSSCAEVNQRVIEAIVLEEDLIAFIPDPAGERKQKRQNDIKKVLNVADSWVGTPYVWGGTSKRGADCSGSIYGVLKEAGYRIHRLTARKMALKYPKTKDPNPGDLVFFDHGKGIAHVGILNAVGQKKNMYHASSSKGFIDSEINEYYWLPKEVQVSRMEFYPVIPE